MFIILSWRLIPTPWVVAGHVYPFRRRTDVRGLPGWKISTSNKVGRAPSARVLGECGIHAHTNADHDSSSNTLTGYIGGKFALPFLGISQWSRYTLVLYIAFASGLLPTLRLRP